MKDRDPKGIQTSSNATKEHKFPDSASNRQLIKAIILHDEVFAKSAKIKSNYNRQNSPFAILTCLWMLFSTWNETFKRNPE